MASCQLVPKFSNVESNRFSSIADTLVMMTVGMWESGSGPFGFACVSSNTTCEKGVELDGANGSFERENGATEDCDVVSVWVSASSVRSEGVFSKIWRHSKRCWIAFLSLGFAIEK